MATKTVAVIANGTVSNIHIANATYTLQSGEVDVTAITPRPMIGWSYTSGTFSAPTLPVKSQAQLATLLVGAASQACDAITAQVNVTETHVPAYVNMARWVSQAGGAPTADPYKTSFANFAASLGATPANVATMFQTFDVATPNLLVALNAVKAAAASPSATAATLATALSAFETAIANEVSALNAALTAASVPTTISAPAAITIAGINA